MKKFFSQPYVLLLGAILVVAAFVRFYQFEPWLHFELDQSRDALVIDEGYKGNFFDLPLLGPKAGGTFLRLGPAYYYLQYISGAIFGETPAGIAFFIPILGTLAVVFVFLLFRRAFTRPESLFLTLLFSVSVYTVLYSRFAWNPNLLIFFMPAGMYALLRSVGTDERYPGRWFVAAIALFTLATQFHFLAFLALPVITVLFLILKRPKFSLKAWSLALGVAVLLYLPMILNESKAGFTNTQEFLGAVTEKSNKEEHNIFEKTIRDVTEYSQHGIVVLTGFEGSTMPAVILQKDEIGTVCRDKCDDGKFYGMAGLLLFALSVIALAWLRFRSKAGAAESNSDRQDFYDLMLIWLAVSFLIFLPLSYGVAPRFYLLVTPLFFVLLGIGVKYVVSFLPENKRLLTFGAIIMLFVLSNLAFLHNRFSELQRAKTEAVDSRPDRILKEQIRVTLEQQEAVSAFLQGRQQATGYPIYMSSDPQYRRSLKYVMDKNGVQNDVIANTTIYKEGEYYLVLRVRGDYEPALRKYQESYDIGEYTPLGTLMIIQLIPKPDKITDVRQDFSIVEKPSNSKAAPRYTWREFFEKQDASQAQDDDGEEVQDN